jgi:hypothetical protein
VNNEKSPKVESAILRDLGRFQNFGVLKYLILLPWFNDPKTCIVEGRWAYGVCGKRNSTLGLEMR